MHVLLLAWGVGEGPSGPSPQAAGLARALVAAGHEVRLVTRADAALPALDGVEVHAVVDAPPIVPVAMRDPALDALAFAGRAVSVAVRRLEERPVDVVHAEGWATGPVVAALRESHDLRVVAVADALTVAGDAAAGMAAALADDADLCVSRVGDGARLPPGVDLPTRRPGPPPARGPVLLRSAPDEDHRTVARDLRAALPGPRRITRSWARRPAAVVVLDPTDLDTVVRGLAAGVPVVAAAGPVGTVVEAAGAGVVVRGRDDAAAATAQVLADPGLASRWGTAAAAAAAEHAWPRVAARWAELAATAVTRADRPRLRAAD